MRGSASARCVGPKIELEMVAVEMRIITVAGVEDIFVVDVEAGQAFALVVGEADHQALPVGAVFAAPVEAVDQAPGGEGFAEQRRARLLAELQRHFRRHARRRLRHGQIDDRLGDDHRAALDDQPDVASEDADRDQGGPDDEADELAH
jgi:hypothetical protein